MTQNRRGPSRITAKKNAERVFAESLRCARPLGTSSDVVTAATLRNTLARPRETASRGSGIARGAALAASYNLRIFTMRGTRLGQAGKRGR